MCIRDRSKSGVEKALEVVGLHKEKRNVFSDYSLGMKQRLGIAAAIMHEPEPVSYTHLDVYKRQF